MIARKKKNIIRFPGGIHLNIGIVVFSFIALYIAFNIYSYFTTIHIIPYEVEQGTIELNTSYTGLIIRKEVVVNAAQSGSLDYYLKDNTKAGNGTLICSIDENGNVSDRLNEAVDSNAVLTEDNLNEIQSSIHEYANGYQDTTFYTTYNFKSDLSGKLMEAVNLGALHAISDYTEYARDNHSFHLYRAEQPGVVAYYTDGMESLTTESITEMMFDQSSYQKVNMQTANTVESGNPVYKLITDENWQIVVLIDSAMKKTLQEGEVVQIQFKEDQTTAWANYSIEQKNGQDYLILNLSNSMVRYAYERYVDINILLDQQSGLKIPNSSITTKTFQLVPEKYFTHGSGTSNQTGLLVEHKQENGTYSKPVFIPATIYYEEDEEAEESDKLNQSDKKEDKETGKICYIAQDNIQKGDRVVMMDSTERYEISKTAKLKGVYNINRGYAVFKQIEELFSNNNYTIVKAGTEYGITLYDFIALEGNSVEEDQMVHR